MVLINWNKIKMRAIHNETEQNGHPSFVISGIYLVLVGVIGGITNIIALLKAYQVHSAYCYWNVYNRNKIAIVNLSSNGASLLHFDIQGKNIWCVKYILKESEICIPLQSKLQFHIL